MGKILMLSITMLSISVIIVPGYAFDSEFVIECSTWYESYEITTKSEFIMVWGYGAMDCYKMLDSWAGKLFLWHNEKLISDGELTQAVSYLIEKNVISINLD